MLKQNSTIVVACDLVNSNEVLYSLASDLAEKANAKIHLVHAVVLQSDGSWGSYLPGEFSTPELIKEAEEVATNHASDALDALCKKFPANIQTSFSVLLGDPTFVLLNEAKDKNASLIMVGTGDLKANRLMKEFSTAISIAAQSTIPVMITGGSDENLFKKDSVSYLLADDLTDHSLSAVKELLPFTQIIKASNLHHVHVHGGLFDNVHDSIIEFMAKNWKALNPDDPSPEAMLLAEQKNRHDALNKRGEQLKESVTSKGGIYQSHFLLGNPKNELHDFIKENDLDILVFGRHKLAHLKPFSVGKVPLRSVIEENKVILVLPPKE